MNSTDHMDYCDNLKIVTCYPAETKIMNRVLAGLSLIMFVVLTTMIVYFDEMSSWLLINY